VFSFPQALACFWSKLHVFFPPRLGAIDTLFHAVFDVVVTPGGPVSRQEALFRGDKTAFTEITLLRFLSFGFFLVAARWPLAVAPEKRSDFGNQGKVLFFFSPAGGILGFAKVIFALVFLSLLSIQKNCGLFFFSVILPQLPYPMFFSSTDGPCEKDGETRRTLFSFSLHPLYFRTPDPAVSRLPPVTFAEWRCFLAPGIVFLL